MTVKMLQLGALSDFTKSYKQCKDTRAAPEVLVNEDVHNKSIDQRKLDLLLWSCCE